MVLNVDLSVKLSAALSAQALKSLQQRCYRYRRSLQICTILTIVKNCGQALGRKVLIITKQWGLIQSKKSAQMIQKQSAQKYETGLKSTSQKVRFSLL